MEAAGTAHKTQSKAGNRHGPWQMAMQARGTLVIKSKHTLGNPDTGQGRAAQKESPLCSYPNMESVNYTVYSSSKVIDTQAGN